MASCRTSHRSHIWEPVLPVERGNNIPVVKTHLDKIVYGTPIHIYGILEYVVVMFDLNAVRRIYPHAAGLLS